MKHLMCLTLMLLISIPHVSEAQESYTLLLLDFENKSEIQNPLLAEISSAISYFLSEQTGEAQVRVVSTPDRDALLTRATETQPNATLLEDGLLVAEWVDADALIIGSYTKEGEQWSLQAQVYHLAEGKTRQTIESQGDDLYLLLDDFPVQLLQQFDVSYVALTTDSWKAYEAFRKGYAAFENYNFPGALQHYEKALELDPILALAYAEQSRLYFMTGQVEQAGKAIETVQQFLSKASPMEKLALQALAYMWDTDANVFRGGGTVNLAPGGVWDEPLILQILVETYIKEGKLAEAKGHGAQWLKAIQAKIGASPDDPQLLHEAADYCRKIEQYTDEAIQMELKAVELDSKDYQKYRTLSQLYMQNGDIEASLKWATVSIQHLPDPLAVDEIGWPAGFYSAKTWGNLAASLREGKIPPKRLLRWCETALQMPELHQTYRVVAQYVMVEAYHAMDDKEMVYSTLTALGAAHETDWSFIGPFDAPMPIENRFPERPPFDLCAELDKPHKGFNGQTVRWESLKDGKPLNGRLNVRSLVGKYFSDIVPVPSHIPEPAIVYSCIYVDVPTAVNVRVHTGSSLMRIWLNDNPAPVIQANVDTEAVPDQQSSEVSLSAGLNQFLVATGSGRFSFNFYFRITDANGVSVPGLKYVSMREALASK